ncbi:MAG: ArnT family glycosyltransferase [Vicinamibacterales bacterium]
MPLAPWNPSSAAARTVAAVRLVVVTALAVVAITISVKSLAWPIGGDGPFLLYVGWLFSHLHLVPYRDVFLVNLPGAMYPYAAVGSIFGFTEWGGRAGDLVFLASLMGLSIAGLRRYGWMPGVLAGSMFALVYLEAYALERELLVTIGMAAALAAVTGESLGSRRAALAGFAIGCACVIRPPAGLVLPAFLWYVGHRLRGGARLRAWAWLLAGAGVPALLTAGWLVATGAWAPFIELVTDYWPRYLLIDRTYHQRDPAGRIWSLVTMTLSARRHQFWIAAVAGVAAVTVWGWRRLSGPRGAHVRLLLLVALALAVYVPVSGRLLGYRTLPLRYVLLQLAALAATGPWLWRATLREAAGVMLVLAVVGAAIRVPVDWLAGSMGTRIERRGFLGRKIARDLCPRLRPGDTVQPLDWAEGTQHALLICQAPPATSFIFDFMLYQDTGSAYIQGLRRQFMRELADDAPRFVLEIKPEFRMLVSDVPADHAFPALTSYLADRYRVAADRGAYRIYERRE